VRERVTVMVQEFGIREFQFYDWFADYSTPVSGEKWTDAYFRRTPISRATIQMHIDEVHRHGARAWAYVQAVGSEERDLENEAMGIRKMLDHKGQWYWHPPNARSPRFPTYMPSAGWARHMTERWAGAIKQLGFDGVHWDTLGSIAGDKEAERQGTHDFLRTAGPLLAQRSLLQTMNMVDLAWWDRAIVRELLAFPYVEIWSQKKAERYFQEMDSPDMATFHGVMAMYPTTDLPQGTTATEVIRARHLTAAQHRLCYLIVGDGARRMKNEYWPDTVPLNDEERALLRTDAGR
jgi:hypothetical protein